ncbi:hypothetical protein GCM10027184_71660 [Saccharothrix stipae]
MERPNHGQGSGPARPGPPLRPQPDQHPGPDLTNRLLLAPASALEVRITTTGGAQGAVRHHNTLSTTTPHVGVGGSGVGGIGGSVAGEGSGPGGWGTGSGTGTGRGSGV